MLEEKQRPECVAIHFNGHINCPAAVDECLEFFDHRLSHHPAASEFPAFFRYQFTQYMLLKENSFIGIIEGDMVSDLILDAFEEAEASLRKSMVKVSRPGWINILSQVKLTFPCHFDS